ncbi:CCA tRNA nucleotidyltransferase [Chroococcidiopsis sp. TS-821]|uniref:CCA tRNA nucleotidyltransferase n=1 Tax=Chroococcidiopsis sp. TS-821 TaxID=1378066 RepID=UPI000CEE7CFD|nr:CCA tRNA nucleotidyltransferase [Chroococcidiopsis sp. TS-821]PPS45460.1 [cytidine(C)-cytidine(C)-adenosine (A)]-adding enzyme [Chroococcidiopsis sp. TS-821]
MCRNLSRLSPQKWCFSLDLLPQPIYLVGGAVRDALLGRSADYLDLDFVLPENAIETARSLAYHYKAGFVILDAQRQIARVVFPQATVDFARQEGSSLETDLRRRDFTVNAIAYNPHTQEIIDPLDGCIDLQQQRLRMVSLQNLQDDPLRLLRAYRQAAQLGFTIESNTRLAIRTLAPQIKRVAAERVRVELSYLLAHSQGTLWLQKAAEDGLIKYWFPNANVNDIAAVDTAVVKLSEIWSQLNVELYQHIRDTIKTTWLGIAKLACLVTPQLETAEAELMQLTCSRAEIRGVTTLLKLLPQLQTAPLSVREQYFFFQEAGRVFPAIALLAVAKGSLIEAIAPLINRYLNPQDPVAHPTMLVTGQDLIQALKIKPGPQVGRLLTEIAIAQAEGKITTAAQALEYASQMLDS